MLNLNGFIRYSFHILIELIFDMLIEVIEICKNLKILIMAYESNNI